MDMADKAVLYSSLCFFWEFGEVGAAKLDVVRLSEGASAAFRRLCVETIRVAALVAWLASAAFRRLCVETKLNARILKPSIFSRLQAAVC